MNNFVGKTNHSKLNSDLPADQLHGFFNNLGYYATKNLVSSINSIEHSQKRNANSIFIASVIKREIIATQNLANKKSPGYDGIFMNLIKKFQTGIIKTLCIILNKSFQLGIFPNNCNIAKIIPVYKSSDMSDYKNYRTISLSPSISKIVEKLLLNRILFRFLNNVDCVCVQERWQREQSLSVFNYIDPNFASISYSSINSNLILSSLEKNNILNNNQHGFRNKHSSSTALAALLNFITAKLDNNKFVLCLFLYLAKAFDSIIIFYLLKRLMLYAVLL